MSSATPNASSGLTNGSILVSTDPNLAYKRLVLSVADNPAGHTVSLVTTQAALADILLQGTVQFFGDSFVPELGPGAHPKSLSTTISLGPTTLYDNGQVEIDVPSGQLTFAPDFRIAAEFGGTPSFDLDISATMEFDLMLHASWQNNGLSRPARESANPFANSDCLAASPFRFRPIVFPSGRRQFGNSTLAPRDEWRGRPAPRQVSPPRGTLPSAPVCATGNGIPTTMSLTPSRPTRFHGRVAAQGRFRAMWNRSSPFIWRAWLGRRLT